MIFLVNQSYTVESSLASSEDDTDVYEEIHHKLNFNECFQFEVHGCARYLVMTE